MSSLMRALAEFAGVEFEGSRSGRSLARIARITATSRRLPHGPSSLLVMIFTNKTESVASNMWRKEDTSPHMRTCQEQICPIGVYCLRRRMGHCGREGARCHYPALR